MRLFLGFLLTIFLICTGFVPPAHALIIDQMRLGAQQEKTRLVLDMSAASDFRVFALSAPYRVVIDLPDFEWRAAKPKGMNVSGITDIRKGRLQPGVSRIVLDMKGPVAINTAFSLPGESGGKSRLVVDYQPVSESVFQREQGNIFGTLLQEGNPSAPSPSSEPAPVDTVRIVGATTLSPPLPAQKPRGQAPQGGETRKPLIVIDPGHGGVDPGAVGSGGAREKDVTLALAKELKRQLEQSGQYRAILTRDTDVFIKLGDRVKFARKHNADLFVSIHADSIDKKDVKGASVYTLSENASDAQTEKLAARENRADLIAGLDLSHEDDDVAGILVDLAMRDTMNQSKFFAGRLVESLQQGRVQTLERPHRHAGFAVLKAPDIPSILIEAGFMSNRTESEKLTSPSYRQNLASAMKRGIDIYFDQVRKSQRL